MLETPMATWTIYDILWYISFILNVLKRIQEALGSTPPLFSDLQVLKPSVQF